MTFSTYFSKQARKPSGMFGRFFMSRFFERGNAPLNVFVYETLCVEKCDHILEIGFGPGVLMKKIAAGLDTGSIEGIDFSESMVAAAQKKNRKHINSGKVKIQLGDIETIEFEENRFDKIFTVNTIYFWKDPGATISRIFRLLKPGGKVVIGFHAREEMENSSLDPDVFRLYSPQDVHEILTIHGSFNDVSIISKAASKNIHYCAVGTR